MLRLVPLGIVLAQAIGWLTTAVAMLHQILPLGQFVDAARSEGRERMKPDTRPS